MREQQNPNFKDFSPEAQQNFVGFLQLLLELDEKQKRTDEKSLSINRNKHGKTKLV